MFAATIKEPAYQAGLPNAGIVGTWELVPARRSYPALSGSQAWQDLPEILVNPAVTVPVTLPNVTGAVTGSSVSLPITVTDLTGLGARAYDLQVTYNPAVLQPLATPYDTSGTLSSGMIITPNATNSGHLIISAFQATDLSGSGTLLNLKFAVVGTAGQSTPLTFENYTDPNTLVHAGFRFNAGNPQASTTNGSLSVNTAPTFNASPVTRPAGSPISNSTIATVNDNESGAGGVSVTVTSANPSNAVTVSNVVNTNGTVTADVVAACGATNASFSLTATDGAGATATATLNVTVNPNTAPTLSYNSAALVVGNSISINPATGPADNGSITSIAVQSLGTFTGSIGVNSAGVVSISNATPFGSHSVTIRVTDNCGAISDANLPLNVTDIVPPDTSIDGSPANPNNSSSASFIFSGTDSGSGVGSFECKLDAGAFATCISPKVYTSLSDDSHTFQVRAIDIAGNQDPTPASSTWLIDTTGPTTTIESTPTDPTNSTSAAFGFSAVDAGSGLASFECKLDAGSFGPCSSPTVYASLSSGSHAFQVRAIDQLGNVGSGRSFTWVINAAPAINAAQVTRQAGSPISSSTIATVNDTESGPSGVTVTVTSANPSNGVTVLNIVNTGGTVTADVVANCGATSASFTLIATDGGGATSTATLNITTQANTVPALVYSTPQNVVFGGSLNITPTTASDNGSIAGYSLQSVVPALTTAPALDASGVVLVTNAQPSGSHGITVRVTDNCGASTDAVFTLDVGAAPSPTPTATPTPTPTPTATPTPTPTTIQFSASSYTVGEGDQHVNISVTRFGDTSSAARVDFVTSDTAGSQNCNVFTGVASSRCDYKTSLGTLRFSAGENSQVISILINDDAYVEGIETFTLGLANPSGASLGAQSSATVAITDNETADGVNPIDASSFFVRLHYLDFLNREPDTSGFAFWTNEITTCNSNVQCIEVKRINVSASFYLSIEFQDTGYFVERIYKVAYGDTNGTSTFGGTHQLSVPIIRVNEFFADTQEIGQGVVVGQGNWKQQLEDNKNSFTQEFVPRPRFTSAFPSTMTPAQFVDTLNRNAGNPLSPSEANQLANELAGGARTRAQVLRAVAEDPDLNNTEFNRAFVLMQYFGYLRRNPNDPQDSDYTGYDFWLTKLNQFNGNYIDAEMVKAFISSIEYRQRFGP